MQTAGELREINDCVILHTNQADCVKYMQSVENEKIFLIISGKEAMSILSKTKSLKQLDSIFIFCLNVKKYQYLLEKYDLIVDIYDERSNLINSIKQNVKLLQRQLYTFNFYNEHTEKATRDISKESAEFLWFQLFKDVLLQMPRNQQAKQELIVFSRQYYRGNRKEYENIIEFEKLYQSDNSIYWYTKDSFLYRLVNKALRTEDIEQLHIFRFFISDLSSMLAKIHKEQNVGQKQIITLYRGLKLEIDEYNRLKQNLGCIISTNGFLSTSRSDKEAIKFAMKLTKRNNVIPVLYEIECNLNVSESVIFADITKYSEFEKEQEILFDVGSTFKIESITKNEQLNMDVVKLIATDDGMKMVQKYIELNRKMNEETSPNILFGILLIQMGKYDQSLNYFKNLLDISDEKVDEGRIYSAMGSAYLCKGELEESHQITDHAYRIMIGEKHSRIKDSTRPMTVMAHIYLRKKMYEKSLDFYFEVLKIHKDFHGRKHLDTAETLNNIGNVYYKMEEYSISLSFYRNSFEILKAQLPYIHLGIAASLNNLGLVHRMTKDMDEAVNCFQESLNIRKQVLPSNHNDIIQSLDNLTHLFYENHDIENSLKYFTEILNIQKIKFDPDDRDDLLSRLKTKFGTIME
ncbi:unnamed protein product [Rotaria sp. Silwood2]|nr:unnamed protein product [Rotaria sp. Silwood2]